MLMDSASRPGSALVVTAAFNVLALSFCSGRSGDSGSRSSSSAIHVQHDSDGSFVVLVGGSTRIPKVRAMLSAFFGGRDLNQVLYLAALLSRELGEARYLARLLSHVGLLALHQRLKLGDVAGVLRSLKGSSRGLLRQLD